MPSTGGTSFLHTVKGVKEITKEDVSMPSTGGTSFLPQITFFSDMKEYGVNALYGRDLISTVERDEVRLFMSTGVNALYGRDLISTERSKYLTKLKDRCQCPLRAGPHFYFLSSFAMNGVKMQCVNALYGRDLISTAAEIEENYNKYHVSMPSTGGTSFLLHLSEAQCL